MRFRQLDRPLILGKRESGRRSWKRLSSRRTFCLRLMSVSGYSNRAQAAGIAEVDLEV